MASVFKKQGRWWVRFKDGTGRWRDISTKVDTKTAAKQMAKELEIKAERQRRGLEPLHDLNRRVTFGEVMDLWWKEYGKKLASDTIHPFSEKHLRKSLGPLPLFDVTGGKIESVLNETVGELAPRSINHL